MAKGNPSYGIHGQGLRRCAATVLLAFLIIGNVTAQPTQWESRGIGGGGALYCPSFNPGDPNELHVSCDMGEVFYSKNGGGAWSQHAFKQLKGWHESLVSYTNSNARYCIGMRNDVNTPMKSGTSGTTWNPMTMPGGGDAYYLASDYHDAQILVLSDYNNLYFSNNAGQSYSNIYLGSVLWIAGSAFLGDTILVCSNKGIHASYNAGQSWSLLSFAGLANPDIKSFSAARVGNTLRCLVLTYTPGNIYPGYTPSDGYTGMGDGLYTLDNLSGSWKSVGSTINFSSTYPIFVGMAENDIQTLWMAGGSAAGEPVVYKSTDAGANWANTFLATSNQNIRTGWSGYQGDRQWSYGEAAWGFSVARYNSSIAAMTDLGFVHTTQDGGANWTARYVDPASLNPKNANTPKLKSYKGCGLENTTAWQLLWLDSNTLLAGFSDINGIRSADKGKTWKFLNGLNQNSVYRLVRTSNGNVYAATGTVHDMYQTTRIQDGTLDGGGGGVYLSTDQGNNFSLIHNFANPVVWIAADPTNADRLYASVVDGTVGGIYVTNNLSAGASSTWSKLTDPPRTKGHPYNIQVLKNGNIVVSYSAHTNSTRSTFYNRSGVFLSTDGGSTWLDRSDAGMQYYTKDITIDPNDTSQSTWYASVFHGWANTPANQQGLYRSTNKGISWTKIFSASPVDGCTVDPSDPNKAYLCTEDAGLFYSSNALAATPTWTLVQSYEFAHPTRVFFDPYTKKEWVCAFGNGIKTALGSLPLALRSPAGKSPALFYPNPTKDRLFYKGSGPVQIYTLQGRLMYEGIIPENGLDISTWNEGLYYSLQGIICR